MRAVLLQAKGKFFSVGGDIAMFADDLDGAPATVLQGTFGMHMALARLRRLDAPLIGCVRGTAMGGAVAILSNCDLVYSASSARFGAAYPHLGFNCDLGATHGLASRMGVARARRCLLLGDTLDARTALDAGLVDFVIEDHVRREALAAARRIAHGPSKAYGELRRLFDRVLSNPFETQLEDEAQALARAAGTADAREGHHRLRRKAQAGLPGPLSLGAGGEQPINEHVLSARSPNDDSQCRDPQCRIRPTR